MMDDWIDGTGMTPDDVLAGLEGQGLHVGDRWVTRFFGDFVLGVATKQAP